MDRIHIRRQLFATVSASLVSFSFGWATAWATANFLDLQSKSTLLPDGPITYSEAAVMMSAICLGGLIGNTSYLWILGRFGRKKPIFLLAIPIIASWVFIIFAKNAYWLYASRICSGLFGGGYSIAAPVFVTEISSDSVRGQMNSILFVAGTVGSLTGFVAALFFDYRMQAICALIVPMMFMLVFFFVPETPAYLKKLGKHQLAEKALEYYKGIKELPETVKFIEVQETDNTSNCLTLHDFFGTRSSRRAILISFSLVYFPQLSGIYILLSYTTAFFSEAGSSLTPLQSSIVICVVQLIAGGLSTVLVDRLGRKVILIVSSVGCGLGTCLLAVHRMYKNELPGTDWVPMYGLAFTIFLAAVGVLPVPHVLTIDLLPPKIRNLMMTLTVVQAFLVGFVTNLAYLYLLQVIKLHGCLFVFSGFSFIFALFVMQFIPETKGKSSETIRRLLEK